jgi:hypothetical protein
MSKKKISLLPSPGIEAFIKDPVMRASCRDEIRRFNIIHYPSPDKNRTIPTSPEPNRTTPPPTSPEPNRTTPTPTSPEPNRTTPPSPSL